MPRFIFYLIIVLLSVSCAGKQKRESFESSKEVLTENLLQFPFPSIPVMFTDTEDRKAYLLNHYWDKFNFADTVLVNNRELTEQGFVNNISLLADKTNAKELVKDGIDNFCSAMEKHEHARKVCMQMVDDYLYNPNSPYYNEELYALYLERMLESKMLDDARKSTLKFKLDLIRRNTPGTVAMDFDYVLPDGKKNSLLRTGVKGDRLLLVFYDPECPSCHDVMNQMIMDEALRNAVADGKVTVLAVYTEGDVDVWKKSLRDMPEGWIVVHDNMVVKEKALYDLKAMPSIYLLDGEKKVILKDAMYGEVRSTIYKDSSEFQQ